MVSLRREAMMKMTNASFEGYLVISLNTLEGTTTEERHIVNQQLLNKCGGVCC